MLSAKVWDNKYRCQAICDHGGIGIRARLRGVSDKGTGSSPVDRTEASEYIVFGRFFVWF